MKDIQIQLEELVDAVGLNEVVKGLSEVCYAKHIKTGSMYWHQDAQVFDNAVENLTKRSPMEYKITWMYDAGEKSVMATVPFEWYQQDTALRRAYYIAELVAKHLFGKNAVLREIKGQLYPIYWADKETGQTIGIE